MNYLKSILMVFALLIVFGCERTTTTNYYSITDIQWGRPVNLIDYIGKQFAVVGGGGPGRNGFFPLTVPREDGAVTYTIQVQFMPNQLRMTSNCIYRDHARKIVATLSAEINALAEQIESGYIISHIQEKKTENDGKQCGVEIAPGKYLLLKKDKSLRMYADPKYFLELVPTTSN